MAVNEKNLKEMIDTRVGALTNAASETGDVIASVRFLQAATAKGTGTAVAANKSLVDAIGHTGSAALGTGLEGELATVDSNVDAIKAATDLLTGAETTGTFSYLDAGAEQTILEIAITKRTKIWAFLIDTVNLTQNHTLRVYVKVDGATYRPLFHRQTQYGSVNGDIAIDMVNNNAASGPIIVDTDIKFTTEEGADEGAARDIPYRLIKEQMEP